MIATIAVLAALAAAAGPAPLAAVTDTLPALAPLPMRAVSDVPVFWQTRAERTGYRQTATYDQTVEYVKRLATVSPLLRVQSYGTSAQGRDLVLVVAAKDRAFTPELAQASGKPIVLVQCGIHSGEIEGKDAMLALLRDIATQRPAAAACSTTASCWSCRCSRRTRTSGAAASTASTRTAPRRWAGGPRPPG